MVKKIYTWKTKKSGNSYKFIIIEGVSRTTKNKEGSYLDTRTIESGLFTTRARAKNNAQKWVRFFKAKQELGKKINFSFKQ